MGGTEAIKKLRQIDPHVKAVVSSGYSGESATAEFRQHGFSAAIDKPYTMEQLGKVLREVIGRAESRSQE